MSELMLGQGVVLRGDVGSLSTSARARAAAIARDGGCRARCCSVSNDESGSPSLGGTHWVVGGRDGVHYGDSTASSDSRTRDARGRGIAGTASASSRLQRRSRRDRESQQAAVTNARPAPAVTQHCNERGAATSLR